MTTQDRPLSQVIDQAEPKLWPVVLDRVKRSIKSPFYWLYERRLASKVGDWDLPQHIGFIMDGNRRYARKFGFDHVSQGHLRGAQKLWDVLNWCFDVGVPVVTVWSFSLDNFERDTGEVEGLLSLFEEKTRELVHHEDVHANEVRVRFLGRIDRLPQSLQEAIRDAEAATAEYERYRLNIAMAYGGRQEIASAIEGFLQDQKERGKSLDEVVECFHDESIEPYLYTYGQPEPDLIFRTSGEVRQSGFLLLQSAYSEFYFCDTNWPALLKIDLFRALRSYNDRHRRLGK